MRPEKKKAAATIARCGADPALHAQQGCVFLLTHILKTQILVAGWVSGWVVGVSSAVVGGWVGALLGFLRRITSLPRIY